MGQPGLEDFRRKLSCFGMKGIDSKTDKIEAIALDLIGGLFVNVLNGRGRSLRLRRGGIETLESCRQGGINVFSVSDYPNARELLKEYGVLGFFSDVKYTGGVPKQLELILDKHDIYPRKLLVVGDRADADGEAARIIGARCYLFGGLYADKYETSESFEAVFNLVFPEHEVYWQDRGMKSTSSMKRCLRKLR